MHLGHIFRTDDRTFIVPYFHFLWSVTFSPVLFEPVGDSPSRQIVGSQFNSYLVSGQNFDKVHSHLAGYVCQYLMSVFHFNAEHGVRKRFQHRPLNFY